MADKEEEVKFKKHDLDRLGIFSEMSYLSGEIPRHRGLFRILAPGDRMRSGITKSRSGNQDGYFRKPFPRIFEGDGHVPRIIRTREQRKEKDRIDKAIIRFQLPRPSKKHSTPGDFHGTFFTEPPQAMDPQTREKPERPPPLLNFFTRPGKKGGPGFVDITISKYPEFIAPKEVEEKVWMTKEERKKAAGIPFHTAVGASRFFTKNPYRMDDTPRVPLYVRPVAGKTKKQVIEEAELRLTEKKEEEKKEEDKDEKEEKKKKKKKSPPIFLPVGPAKKAVFFSKFSYLVIPAKKKIVAASLAERRQRKASPPEFSVARCCKPYPQRSIVSHNVDRSINITNWRHFQPFVYA